MTINDVSMTSWVQLWWSCIVVENELFWKSCNWVTMSCTVYTMNYNPATHATCLLALIMYKYSELQIFGATQNWVAGQSQNTHFSYSVCFVSF